MGKREMLTGNSAAAWGARLSRPHVMPTYPITPQTEIIELLGKWVATGELKTQYMMMESEHSAISACISAAAAGARTFTATSSQGLMLMNEMMYIASGVRVPIVMVNVSRALSAPIILGVDQNDVLGQRDTGWLQFHCESCQEILDSVIMAYKIGEKMLLPSIVNEDGFFLSFAREPVDIPDQKEVDEFLPPFKPAYSWINSTALSQGVASLDGDCYSFFKAQQNLAMAESFKVIEEVQDEFTKKFGRKYDILEKYMMDGAEYAFVVSNSISTIAKAAVRELRENGMNIGLLRLRVIRPFPIKQLVEACTGLKGLAIVDRNSSPGAWGITYSEIRSALYDLEKRPLVCGFIAGLGGLDVLPEGFYYMADKLEKSVADGKPMNEFIFSEDNKQTLDIKLKEAIGYVP